MQRLKIEMFTYIHFLVLLKFYFIFKYYKENYTYVYLDPFNFDMCINK